jgi:hypothetical protein
MLTRKHFQAQAEIIKLIKNRTMRYVAADMAIKMFEKENPRFDKDRFLKACNL